MYVWLNSCDFWGRVKNKLRYVIVMNKNAANCLDECRIYAKAMGVDNFYFFPFIVGVFNPIAFNDYTKTALNEINWKLKKKWNLQ